MPWHRTADTLPPLETLVLVHGGPNGLGFHLARRTRRGWRCSLTVSKQPPVWWMYIPTLPTEAPAHG